MMESPLSERELELLRLVSTGASNKEISQQLYISINTVKVHLRNIYSKLEVASRTEAAMWAVQNGLVDTGGHNGGRAGINLEAGTETTGIRFWFDHQTQLTRFGLMVAIALLLVVIGYGVSILIRPRTPQMLTPEEVALVSEIEASRWQQLADMPTARAGLAVASYENLIYAIAGDGKDGVVNVNERYDPSTDSWMELSPKPVAVTDIHAGVVAGHIFIPGGRLADGSVTNLLEIYDPRIDSWSEGAPIPIALSAYAMGTLEGKIYVFGGWDGKKYRDSVYMYDPGQDYWTERTSMPTARGFMGAAEADGKLFVVGGYDGKKALDVNEVYNPVKDRDGEQPWSVQASLPEGRYGMGVAGLADTIYLIGGTNHTEPGSIFSGQYNPPTDTWQPFGEILVPSHPELISQGTLLFAIGGRDEEATSTWNLAYQAIFTLAIPVVR